MTHSLNLSYFIYFARLPDTKPYATWTRPTRTTTRTYVSRTLPVVQGRANVIETDLPITEGRAK